MSTNRKEALEILGEARSALNGIVNETAADKDTARIGLMMAEHDINVGLEIVRSTSHTSVKGGGLARLAGIAALTDLALAQAISAELEYKHFTAEALARIGRAMARTSSERKHEGERAAERERREQARHEEDAERLEAQWGQARRGRADPVRVLL
jgi:hypothetical protein